MNRVKFEISYLEYTFLDAEIHRKWTDNIPYMLKWSDNLVAEAFSYINRIKKWYN